MIAHPPPQVKPLDIEGQERYHVPDATITEPTREEDAMRARAAEARRQWDARSRRARR